MIFPNGKNLVCEGLRAAIALALLMVVGVAPSALAAENSEEGPDESVEKPEKGDEKSGKFEPLLALRMPIRIERSLLASVKVDERDFVAEKICESIGAALVAGEGPWGLGYVDKRPECTFVDKAVMEKGLDAWTVMFSQKSPNTPIVRICRSVSLRKPDEEKCLAKLALPPGKYLAKVLGHPYFSRAVVATLIEQMVIQSKLTPNLVQKKPDGQRYFMPKNEPELAPRVGIPSFDARLTPVESSYISESGLFRVNPLKRDEALAAMEKKTLWLLNAKGSNRRAGEFKKALILIYKKLSKQIRDIEDKLAHPERIVGRDLRGEIKQQLAFKRRIEGEASVRAGYFSGFGVVQPESSWGGSMDAAVYLSPGLNFWLDGSYTRSVYVTSTTITSGSDSLTSQTTTANFNNSRIGGGMGLRYTFSHDLTFFLYPRASYMSLAWKIDEGKAVNTFGSKAEVDSRLFPLLGVGAGFRSPESWIVNAQLTLGYDGIAAKDYMGMYCDAEVMYELPTVVAAISSFGVFDRAWVSLYARFQRHLFTVSDKVTSSQVDVLEGIGGLGYRLEFL